MTARTGDVIETREQLEALPTGSWIGIVRHEEFRTYEKWDDEWLTERGAVFDPDHLPARVLHVPGEQPIIHLSDPETGPCEWCDATARGFAWHNDSLLHPSCGQVGHGWGWVPGEQRKASTDETPRSSADSPGEQEPTEAEIEAAAAVFYDSQCGPGYEGSTYKGEWDRMAKAALLAAKEARND